MAAKTVLGIALIVLGIVMAIVGLHQIRESQALGHIVGGMGSHIVGGGVQTFKKTVLSALGGGKNKILLGILFAVGGAWLVRMPNRGKPIPERNIQF